MKQMHDVDTGEILVVSNKHVWKRDIPLEFNLLSPHDALKHHFTSLKIDLIFLQLRVLKRKFP